MMYFYIWEYGEDSLTQFIQILNVFHPTIKFTVEWSRRERAFSDVKLKPRYKQPETDLHIKRTETHQCLHSTPCHSYYCKKIIHYSQPLKYNRICSDN